MIAIKAMTAMKLTREDKEPAEIVPGLYLGSIGAAFNKESLDKHQITHILTCADKINPRYPNVTLPKIILIQDYKYMLLPILDTPTENIGKYFRQAYYFINDALIENTDEDVKQRVLVHW